MTTLHIENTVQDFDAWKEAFDRFERFRADQGVRSYRLSRRADNANEVAVDLDFDTVEAATAFSGALEQIWRTPQSQQHLVAHSVPVVYDVVVNRTLSAAAASTS